VRFTGARAVLQVHPTRRCNLTCVHCYSDSGPGAPAGLQCLLTSNGTLVSPRRLGPLAGCLDLLVLSLDGPRPEHDRMRARDGAYDAMARRIAAIRETGIPFGFLFTLTQHNVHQLEWAAGFAAASGASLLQVHPLEASGRGRSLTSSVPDAIEGSYALLEVARLRRAFGETLRFQLDLVPWGTCAKTGFLSWRNPGRPTCCPRCTTSPAPPRGRSVSRARPRSSTDMNGWPGPLWRPPEGADRGEAHGAPGFQPQHAGGDRRTERRRMRRGRGGRARRA
jgi:hypothetical protein